MPSHLSDRSVRCGPDEYTYQPYGETTVAGQASTSSYQYTGRENDGTRLMYYRGRYYGTAAHRFLSENPSGFGGGDMNLCVCWEQPDELHGAAPRLSLQVPEELLSHDLSLSWDRYSASSTRRLCVRVSGSKL
jgi:RHS repeat-associated protein